MCAEAAVITAAHRGRADWRARTLAPVPLKTGNACASGPKWWDMISRKRAVQASPPYPGTWPTLAATIARSEEHTSELQLRFDLVCRLLLEKKKQLEGSCIYGLTSTTSSFI